MGLRYAISPSGSAIHEQERLLVVPRDPTRERLRQCRSGVPERWSARSNLRRATMIVMVDRPLAATNPAGSGRELLSES